MSILLAMEILGSWCLTERISLEKKERTTECSKQSNAIETHVLECNANRCGRSWYYPTFKSWTLAVFWDSCLLMSPSTHTSVHRHTHTCIFLHFVMFELSISLFYKLDRAYPFFSFQVKSHQVLVHIYPTLLWWKWPQTVVNDPFLIANLLWINNCGKHNVN